VPQVWIARDFLFHTSETMPELRLHCGTIGTPAEQPVLVLHGTPGSEASMLTPAFAGELFGSRQPLDASRTKFPRYNYEDMVLAHYRLLTEHLKIGHLRAVIGKLDGRHGDLDLRRDAKLYQRELGELLQSAPRAAH
jgi:homoserine O-acetyltransferase/O-succinyltransferase